MLRWFSADSSYGYSTGNPSCPGKRIEKSGMIGLTGGLAIFLSTRPIDMRKSFDGLCGEVSSYLSGKPTDGSLFVFVNKPRDRMKMLLWDRHGFWIFYKRLEAGRFQLPTISDPCAHSWTLSHDQLVLILEGIDLASVRRRKRFAFSLPKSQ
jgi:transposase